MRMAAQFNLQSLAQTTLNEFGTPSEILSQWPGHHNFEDDDDTEDEIEEYDEYYTQSIPSFPTASTSSTTHGEGSSQECTSDDFDSEDECVDFHSRRELSVLPLALSTSEETEDLDDESSVDSQQQPDSVWNSNFVNPSYESRLEATQSLLRSCVMMDDRQAKPNLHRALEQETVGNGDAGTPTNQNQGTDQEVDHFFPTNVPARFDDEGNGEITKCFDAVHILSPKYFSNPEDTDVVVTEAIEQEEQPQGCNLSTMICQMTAAATAASLHEIPSVTSHGSVKTRSTRKSISAGNASTPGSVAGTANTRSPTCILQMEQYTLDKKDVEKVNRGGKACKRSKLHSAFKSSAVDDCIAYQLATGSKGMSEEHLQRSKNLLPRDPLKTTAPLPSTTGGNPDVNLLVPDLATSKTQVSTSKKVQRVRFHHNPTSTSLSILLVDVRSKVFEIVDVDHVTLETTVGDMLSRARVQATDARLSRQTYLSLCNTAHELAAPMLPVSLLLSSCAKDKNNQSSHASPTAPKVITTGSATPPERMISTYDRREREQERAQKMQRHLNAMDTRLLVAVPEGETAERVRHIQQILWSHPRLRKWWKKQQPKQPYPRFKRDIV